MVISFWCPSSVASPSHASILTHMLPAVVESPSPSRLFAARAYAPAAFTKGGLETSCSERIANTSPLRRWSPPVGPPRPYNVICQTPTRNAAVADATARERGLTRHQRGALRVGGVAEMACHAPEHPGGAARC